MILCSNQNVSFNISVSGDSITCSAPWHYVNVNGKCKCASETNLIKCTDEGTLMRIGYCTTYTEDEGLAMSKCPYLKMKRHAYTTALKDPLYIVLPSNISKLNEYMCGPMNRKGSLCSECIDGFSHLLRHLTIIWHVPTAQLQGTMEFLFTSLLHLFQ